MMPAQLEGKKNVLKRRLLNIKFGVSQASSALGGLVGNRVSSAVCVWALGLATAEAAGSGALLCTAIGLAGAVVGREIGGASSEDVGEFLVVQIYVARFYDK